MTEDDIASLHDRIHAMTDEQRKLLDPIAYALADHQKAARDPDKHWSFVPNRIIALACVDLMAAWEKTIWERE